MIFKLSVVSVFYCEFKQLANCLKAFYGMNETHIIIVDNSIGIKEKLGKCLKKVKYIKSPGNIGYARGNNLGAKHAKGKYLLFLNPDTEVKPGAIEALVKFLDQNPKAAIAAPTLLDESGKVYHPQGTRELTPFRAIFSLSFLSKLFPNNKYLNDYWMLDTSKNQNREVDVVPGSAFMIRRKVFDEIGGFDENFFLYFEESDICKTVKDKGHKIFMIPNAKVTHFWKPAEKKGKHKKYFAQSRFYYFRKHFGLAKALLVEVFARFSKYSLAFAAILLLGAYLRFVDLFETMPFVGDYGWYYLEAKKVLTENYLPLVGIPSSVPILRQGVLWTYLLSFAMWLGNMHPMSGGILSVLLGILGIFFSYLFISNFWSRKVGLIASFIAAINPIIVDMDRRPFQTAAMFPVFAIFGWYFVMSKKLNAKSAFILGLLIGIALQFELAAIILLPIVVVTRFLTTQIPQPKNILSFGGGLIWGMLPFWLYDLQNGVFIQTIGFAVWFLQKIWENFYWVLVFGLLLWVAKKRSGYLKPKNVFMAVWLAIGLGAFVIRPVYSAAYMPILYLPSLVLLSVFINKLYKQTRVAANFLLALIFVVSIYVMWGLSFNTLSYGTGLGKKVEVANYIAEDAAGLPVKLLYGGPDDHFEAGDNHWKYLLEWKGTNLSDDSGLIYEVIEGNSVKNDTDRDFGYIIVRKRYVY